MPSTLIADLLIILAAGLVAAVVCRVLQVSVLVGYLVVGGMIGSGGLHWVRSDHHQIEFFAEAGVFLLLFSIGLEFSLGELARMGKSLTVGGATQMTLVAVPIAAVLCWMGYAATPALLIAAAASFSSTVLVFKALAEWGHSTQTHGRRAIGILLFQDAALIPLLLVLPVLTGGNVTGGDGTDTTDAGLLRFVSLGLISVLFIAAVGGLRFVLAEWLIPRFTRYRSPELIVLFTLVSLGGVTSAAYVLGLPPAIGAFAAGLIFSGNRWTHQIDALVLPFRETFAAIFFVGLGLLFQVRLLIDEPLVITAMMLGLIALKGVAATLALRLTGLNWTAAMGMGVGLAHIGEFAFVLLLLGVDEGLISDADYQRFIAVAIGSLVLTPVLLKSGLKWITAAGSTESDTPGNPQAVLRANYANVIGAGPIGSQVVSQLEMAGHDVCVMDLSAANLHPFAQAGFRTVTGDATDASTLRLAGAETAGLVVVCLPADDVSHGVVRAVRGCNPHAFVLVRCRFQANVNKFNKAGASAVISEETEAIAAISKMLRDLRRVD